MKDDLELHEINDDDLKNLEELERSLKDELKREVNDDGSAPFIKGRRIGLTSNKLLPVLIGIFIVMVFAGSLFYFVDRRATQGDAKIQSKMTDFEQKITNLERQITELQDKLATAGPDSGLLQRLEALDQKVEALEKRAQFKTESKSKLAPTKPVIAAQKRYHTVQKGETLHSISKRYGIAVEELRKLNNLSESQSIQTGQKLIISPEQ